MKFWQASRRIVLAALVPLLTAAAMPALSAEPAVPVFWDGKERLAKPDLSSVERIRFLTTTDFPPFNYLDDSGRLSGLHVDLARAICSELALADRCQIQALPWSELEAALGKGDGEAIIAGLAVSPQTRAKYLFSRPYLRLPARFVMRKSDVEGEPIARKLREKRVGVIAGSTHEQLLRDRFGEIQVVTYQRQDWVLADLKAAKIDAAFGDGMQLAAWLAGPEAQDCCRFAGGAYLAPEYLGSGLAIAVMPGNEKLAAAFDAALQQISAKGTFAELYLRYFPVSFY